MAISHPSGSRGLQPLFCMVLGKTGWRSCGPPSDLSLLPCSLLCDYEVPLELLCVPHIGSVPLVRVYVSFVSLPLPSGKVTNQWMLASAAAGVPSVMMTSFLSQHDFMITQ